MARIQFEYCKLFSCIWFHALILFVKINIIYCLIVSTNLNVIQRSEKNKTKVYLLFCKALRCNLFTIFQKIEIDGEKKSKVRKNPTWIESFKSNDVLQMCEQEEHFWDEFVDK